MADERTEKQKVQEITDKLEKGLKELFELITLSHTKYLATGGAAAEPKIVRREIAKRKLNGNLLIGSACASGEIFDLAQTKSEKALAEAMKFYDFIGEFFYEIILEIKSYKDYCA